MMDAFRKKQNLQCDIGGIHCTCCNPHFGKARRRLNKVARLKLKRDDYRANKARQEQT